MNLYKDQRVCVLVDVQNMYYSGKNLYNCKVNFEELMKTALKGRKLVRALAYAIKADVKDESNFHEALEKIGFEIRTKDLLVFHGGHKKGDWDVGIAMDGVRAAEKVDVLVVVSGDGDFKELYEYVRGKGCRVEVIAFGKTASSSIKDYVDNFTDMDKDKKYLIPLKPVKNGSNNNNTKSNNTPRPKNQGSNHTPEKRDNNARHRNSSAPARGNSGPPKPRGSNTAPIKKTANTFVKKDYKPSDRDRVNYNNNNNSDNNFRRDNINQVNDGDDDDFSMPSMAAINAQQPEAPKISAKPKPTVATKPKPTVTAKSKQAVAKPKASTPKKATSSPAKKSVIKKITDKLKKPTKAKKSK